MTANSFGQGDTVTFKAGPKSTAQTTATVIGTATSARGNFLVTRDAAGVERKVRPGACQRA